MAAYELSLYLNAGYVVSKALEKLAEDYSDEESLFALILSNSMRQAAEKNIPVETVLFDIAKRIKNKDLLHFASLILDNQRKGSSLNDKLEQERKSIQSRRLNDARAQAKKAETKLCFPLLLLLVVLVIICIAPSILNISAV